MNAQERDELATTIREALKTRTIPPTPGIPGSGWGLSEFDLADVLLAAGWTRPDLLPVPVPDADTIERVRELLSEDAGFDPGGLVGAVTFDDLARRIVALAPPVREPLADADTIERAAEVLAEHMWSASDDELCSCGWTPDDYWQYDDGRRFVADALSNTEEGDEPDVWGPIVQAFTEHQATALLASPVPGRSEAQMWTPRIDGTWLVMTTDRCTCSPYGSSHERHCGIEPEVDLSTLPGWRSEAEIKAEALREAAAWLPIATEGPGRIGTARWSEASRDTYSLAVEETQAALRDRATSIESEAGERP